MTAAPRTAAALAAPVRRLGDYAPLIERAIGYVLLSIAAIACITPFLWMVGTSFKSDREVFNYPPPILPEGLQWQNYVTAFAEPAAQQQLVNSLIYAGGSTLANLVFCSLAGYALARLEFVGKAVVFAAVVGLLMVPAQSQIIPVYLIVKHIPFAGGNDWLGTGGSGLLDTMWGVILPTAATPFGIFLMRQFFMRIPVDYIEAARLDGASSLAIFWYILLPLTRPALAVLGVLTFQLAWNDFVWPLILTSSRDMATLQLGLQLIQSGPDAQWNVVMAFATAITLPVIIVFIFAQRYVIDGAVTSGVKG